MLDGQDVGLHNVVELEPAPAGGQFLRRFPRPVRESLTPLGRMVAQEAAGVEIRFVTESRSFCLSLMSQPSVLAPYEQNGQEVAIFRGGFLHSVQRITPGRISHVQVINIGGTERVDELAPAAARTCGFAPQVWRVFLGRYPAAFLGLDTYGYPHRPPTPEEVPAQTWLAYGSSITNGAAASIHHNAYIYHAARAAGLDVCNQGLSGSCHAEAAVAEYLAQRPDWHLLTLEIGINMRGGFTPEAFRARVSAMVDTVCRAHPAHRVVLITIYPNGASPGLTANPNAEATRREAAINQILREIADAGRYPNLTLIPGSDILEGGAGLSQDTVHPSDYGHAAMGRNLAAVIARGTPALNGPTLSPATPAMPIIDPCRASTA